MGESTERGIHLRWALPYLTGLLALALMLIPQLWLSDAYHLIVRAALAGLSVYLAATRSARQAIFFTLTMAACAWLLDLNEGAMIAFFAAAGIILVLAVGRLHGPVYARVAVGCLIGAVVLVGCMAGLMLWRKESGLVKALQFGLASEWQTIIAVFIGATVGGYLANRKAV